MNQIPVKLGPLALLLSVISICLTTLSILAFTTSRADMRLAEKYAETVRLRYELEAEGQTFLRDLDRGEASGEPDGDGVLRRTIEKDGSRLLIGVDPSGEIVSWRHEKEWNQDTSIGNLWMGF